jgi:uncharacterized membrane protein
LQLRRATVDASFLVALAVIASGAAAFAWFLHEALIRLYSLQGTAWDLGFDQQVVWNIANGHGFYSSFAHANFLTQHFEVILVLPAIVERLWPDPRVLLILGDLGLAATAPAAYLMIREILRPRPRASLLAGLLAAPIPFWAATQQAARDDFHPENMALALALLATWAGLRGSRKLMWVLIALVLCCKEDQTYTVAVAGLVIAFTAPAPLRRMGWWVMGAAAAWLVLIMGVAQNVIRYQQGSGFVYTVVRSGLNAATPKSAGGDYYDWMLHPNFGVFLQTLANWHAWSALLVMVLSMCALPLLQPRWFSLVVPPFAANLLSHHAPQAAMVQHYALLTLFPLIVAGAMGARLLPSALTSSGAVVALAIVPLAFGFAYGTLPPGRLADNQLYSVANARVDLRAAENVIPSQAPVAADDGITPWLAARNQIEGFPSSDDAGSYVVVDRDSILQPASWKATHEAAVGALQPSGRRLLFDDGRIQVWSPIEHAPDA